MFFLFFSQITAEHCMRLDVLKTVCHRSVRYMSAVQQSALSGSLQPFQEIPGPRALPLIGSTWKYILPLPGETNQ